MSEHLDDVKDALKKAGRGGWRVDLKAVCDVANKTMEEQKKKFSASFVESKKGK